MIDLKVSILQGFRLFTHGFQDNKNTSKENPFEVFFYNFTCIELYSWHPAERIMQSAKRTIYHPVKWYKISFPLFYDYHPHPTFSVFSYHFNRLKGHFYMCYFIYYTSCCRKCCKITCGIVMSGCKVMTNPFQLNLLKHVAY